MQVKHTKDDILAILDKVEVAMKGDPKTIQITSNPSVSLMVFDRGRDTNLASRVLCMS